MTLFWFTFGDTHNPLFYTNQTVIELRLKGPLMFFGLERLYFWLERLFPLKANCEIQDKQSSTKKKRVKRAQLRLG